VKWSEDAVFDESTLKQIFSRYGEIDHVVQGKNRIVMTFSPPEVAVCSFFAWMCVRENLIRAWYTDRNSRRREPARMRHVESCKSN